MENILIQGEPTEFEKKINLGNTFFKQAQNSTYFDNPDLELPVEELVMKIA